MSDAPTVETRILQIRGNTVRVLTARTVDHKKFEVLIEAMGPMTEIDVSWLLQAVIIEIYKRHPPVRSRDAKEMM